MAYTNSEITHLLQKQAALNTAIAEAREKETRLALIEMVQKMREYDISLEQSSRLMEWTPPPEAASMCQSGSVEATT
jgi:predicted RNA binding protein with dsRBD fold (UPF0201 family)